MPSTSAKSKRAITKAARQAKFLASFAECGIIGRAAKEAGIDRNQHYDWLADPEYERRFKKALEQSNDAIESEIWRRGHDGVNKPIWFQGKKCGTVREYSDTLLIFYAKGRMPHKYRETFKGEITHSGAIRHDPDLAALTDEQLEYLKALFDARGGARDPANVPERSEG